MKKRIIVVGSGNAALCAALAAAQNGAQVTVVEAAPEEEYGGNSRYTAGALRFSYSGREEILQLLSAETKKDERIARTDFGAYPAAKFLAELTAAADGQGNHALHKLMAGESYATMAWLKDSGINFLPIYSRQAYQVDGKYVFWGGLTLAAEDEGEGLIRRERELAQGLGVKFIYNAPAKELIYDGARVRGVVCGEHKEHKLAADAVVLACGGFEANPAQREQHIGKGWSEAKVRGTKHNQGDGLAVAQAVGAKLCGNWGGCHAVFMDSGSPDYGNLDIPHIERKNYRKISYPFGVMINRDGKRFVDEGADFRNYTYAKYGKEVLAQPGGFAWQIFDAQVTHLLYDEYNMAGATKRTAERLEDLVAQLDDIDRDAALQTLQQYNAAVDDGVEFNPTIKDGKAARFVGAKTNPTVKDGKAARGAAEGADANVKDGKAAKSAGGVALNPPKSNWATRLVKPPFSAYRVTCGITFTYGGLAIDTSARVLDEQDKPIAGLYTAGEMVGDIFHHNYPGGSGLTSGSVFGRIAGLTAATD